MNNKINKVWLLAVVGCLLGTVWSAPVAKKPRFCGKLSSFSPAGEVSRKMAHYGLKAVRYTDGTNTFQALLYVSKSHGARKVPLLVYLPGNGERGDLANQFRQQAIFELVTGAEFQRRTPCHLLAISPPETARTLCGGMPGCPNQLQRLMHDLIFEVAASGATRVDRTRIYLTGFSYGGAGVYALMQHYPGEFAAAMPIASLPPLEEYFSKKHPGNCWHFYNEGDYQRRGMPMRSLEAYRDMTNAAGGDFRIGSYPAGGHDAWTAAWKEPGVWSWMFSKTSDGKPVPKMSAKQGLAKPSYDFKAAKCTASVAGRDSTCGPDRATDGLDDTVYVPEHAFTKKDWWMVEFPHPVKGKVQVFSGDRKGKGIAKGGIVEVSENGKTWISVGTFSKRDGICSFSRARKFTHLRVRAQSECREPFLLRRCSLVEATR